MDPGEHESKLYYKKLLPVAVWRRLLTRQQERIYRRFVELFPPTPEASVLNVGVNADLKERRQYFLESRYPYLDQVTGCGLESEREYARLFPEASYLQVFRDRPLPFEDGQFDLAFCSAVVEHVGSRENQRRFVADVVRVSRRSFFTTPNRWYPVDLHTQLPLLHYLPGPVHRRLYRLLGFEFFSHEENLNLLSRSDLAALVPPGKRFEIHRHWFLGLPSNLLLAIR